MLSGLNTDIQYKGKTYHVQTEDGGAQSPVITTLLFDGGAIFASRKRSYKDSLPPESSADAVREMMKEQHKEMMKELISGKFNQPDDPPTQAHLSEEKAKPNEKKKKNLDDLILDYLSQKEDS